MRSAPPADYDGHPYDLGRFHWTRSIRHSRERLSGFHEDERPALLRQAHAVRRTGGDVEVTIRHEDWYAMLPRRGDA